MDLTKRELEILNFLASGFTREQTATLLGLKPHIVTEYLRDICDQVSVRLQMPVSGEPKRYAPTPDPFAEGAAWPAIAGASE
ncbi:MAG: LuxR C-terminal-related transcriptional regulator [Thermomicrobiales bacterium]